MFHSDGSLPCWVGNRGQRARFAGNDALPVKNNEVMGKQVGLVRSRHASHKSSEFPWGETGGKGQGLRRTRVHEEKGTSFFLFFF